MMDKYFRYSAKEISLVNSAATDLAVDAYKLVNFGANRVLSAAGAGNCIAVNREAIADKDMQVPCAVSGVTYLRAGAAFSCGAPLKDSSGRVVTSTTAARIVGIALSSATYADDLVPVLLVQGIFASK